MQFVGNKVECKKRQLMSHKKKKRKVSNKTKEEIDLTAT